MSAHIADYTDADVAERFFQAVLENKQAVIIGSTIIEIIFLCLALCCWYGACCGFSSERSGKPSAYARWIPRSARRYTP